MAGTEWNLLALKFCLFEFPDMEYTQVFPEIAFSQDFNVWENVDIAKVSYSTHKLVLTYEGLVKVSAYCSALQKGIDATCVSNCCLVQSK